MQLVVHHRQRQQRSIQLAFAQAVQQHVALFLDQQQFQLREALADARDHMRQQVRAEGREDAQAHRAGFGSRLRRAASFSCSTSDTITRARAAAS